MTERMDFADGKYTVINENGKLTALRHGEPWGRDLTGDNLIYWMLMDALKLKAERDALAAKLAELEGQEPVAVVCDTYELRWIGRGPIAQIISKHQIKVGDYLFARPVPAEQHVNARLLTALKACRHKFAQYVAHHISEGDMHKAMANEAVVAMADVAIMAAAAAPRVVRLTDEEVASLLADSDKNSLSVPSFFMVEPHKFARAIETAVFAKNGIEVAE